MGGGRDIKSRILESLEEKPRSISEIARELDEEKYEVSKKIDVLVEKGKIDTYRIGRSTACMLAEDEAATMGDSHDPEEPEPPEQPDEPDGIEPPEEETEKTVQRGGKKGLSGRDEQPSPREQYEEDIEDWFEQAWDDSSRQRSTPQRTPTGSVAPDAVAAAEAQAEAHVPAAGETSGSGPRTIGIVSGKGGVGKTVVTLNLGAALMDLGENVIVMDSDAEMPNVGLQLGMYTYPTSLKQVVEQDVHIMSAMHVDKDSGLRVIPTSLSKEPVQEHVEQAIQMIPDEYIVLIDSPPGFDRPLERVIDTCDELIFVTTPEIPSVTDTYKLVQEAKQRGKKVLGAVVNMYSSPKKHLSVAEVEKSLEMPVLGVVDHSKVVQRSIFDTQPAVSMKPHAKPSREFKQIAADLTGKEYEPSLFDRIRGFMP